MKNNYSFYSLQNAINRLKEVLNFSSEQDFIKDATIQRFEFVIELYWKVLKKILAYEKVDATTPRDTLSKAYQLKLVDDEEIWLKMLDERNNISHAYNEQQANIIYENIKTYLPIFKKTYIFLNEKYNRK